MDTIRISEWSDATGTMQLLRGRTIDNSACDQTEIKLRSLGYTRTIQIAGCTEYRKGASVVTIRPAK